MIEVLPAWTPPEPALASDGVFAGGDRSDGLSWAPPAGAAPPATEEKPPTLGDFSRALARAEVLDNGLVDLPGAVVALPYGVELLNRFRDRVHAVYRSHGLDEHEFPMLAPLSVLAPAAELLDLRGKLLYAGSDADLANGGPGMALLPTGEAAVYASWAKRVRSRGDLPIRMYRRARYFRPVSRGRHAGRGVFYAMEHDDVFEFHCAYADDAEMRAELPRWWQMLGDVAGALHLPVLWSTRPPWTNRHEVAEWALAGDVPLPIRATTQVGSLYNQGTRFSRPYGIGFREDGELHLTAQLAGYVSRRLLLVHLLLGMRAGGELFLHPDVAPAQVVVVLRGGDDGMHGEIAAGLVGQLEDAGVRARLVSAESPGRLRSELSRWSTRGVPLIVLLFAPREEGEPFRVVVRRADTGEEAVLPEGAGGLVSRCRELLAEVGESWDRRTQQFVAGRLVETGTAASLHEALADRRVAVAPLAIEEEVVREVDGWRSGEVLGFCRTERLRPCVVSGVPAGTVALISPRV